MKRTRNIRNKSPRNLSKNSLRTVDPKAGQHLLRRHSRIVLAKSLELLKKQHSITTVEELYSAVECGMGRPIEMSAADWASLIEIIRAHSKTHPVRPRRFIKRMYGVLAPERRVVSNDAATKKLLAEVEVVSFDASKRRFVKVKK